MTRFPRESLFLFSSSHLSVPEVLQSELVGQLAGAHGVGQVLLVGEDEQVRVTQLVFLELEEEREKLETRI